jgi:hypothetical protein
MKLRKVMAMTLMTVGFALWCNSTLAADQLRTQSRARDASCQITIVTEDIILLDYVGVESPSEDLLAICTHDRVHDQLRLQDGSCQE